MTEMQKNKCLVYRIDMANIRLYKKKDVTKEYYKRDNKSEIQIKTLITGIENSKVVAGRKTFINSLVNVFLPAKPL